MANAQWHGTRAGFEMQPTGELVKVRADTYLVTGATSPEDAVLAAGGAVGGAAHPNDALLLFQKADVNSKDAWKLGTYEVTMNWSTKAPDAQTVSDYQANQSPSSDPVNAPPELEIDGEIISEASWKDIDGKLVVNTAGDPFFDPAPELDRGIVKVALRRVETSFSVSQAMSLSNVINDGYWNGAAAKTLKLDYPRARRFWANGFGWRWNVSYNFSYNEKGWQPELLNQGLRERKQQTDGSFKTVPIVVPPLNQPVTDPHPLDAAGKLIPPEDLRSNPSLAHYITHKRYRVVNFSSLGF